MLIRLGQVIGLTQRYLSLAAVVVGSKVRSARWHIAALRQEYRSTREAVNEEYMKYVTGQKKGPMR